jgi:hypothetical protein
VSVLVQRCNVFGQFAVGTATRSYIAARTSWMHLMHHHISKLCSKVLMARQGMGPTAAVVLLLLLLLLSAVALTMDLPSQRRRMPWHTAVYVCPSLSG